MSLALVNGPRKARSFESFSSSLSVERILAAN